MDRFAWLYASRPSGARQVLSSIGGSIMTVAGTVFSVTIADAIAAVVLKTDGSFSVVPRT